MNQQYGKVIEDLVSGAKEGTHREITVNAYEKFNAGDEEVLKEIPLHSCALLTSNIYHKKLQYDFVRKRSQKYPELKKCLDASACMQLEDYSSALVILNQLGGFSDLDALYKFLYVKCLNANRRHCAELTIVEIRRIAAELGNYREVVFDLAYNSIFLEGGISFYEEILSEMRNLSLNKEVRKISASDIEIISKSLNRDSDFFAVKDEQNEWVDIGPYHHLNPPSSVILKKEATKSSESPTMNSVALNEDGFRKYSIHELRRLDGEYSGVEIDNR